MSSVREVLGLLGWTCKACRRDMIEEIRKLRLDLEDLSNRFRMGNVAGIGASKPTEIIGELDLDPSVVASQGDMGLVGTGIAGVERKMSYADVTRIVSKTITETNYRKRNIIISGLAECEERDDGEWFRGFCQDELNIKPRLAMNGARRLGRLMPGKPRRLLVRFDSEAAATEVLDAGRTLRRSNDDYIARNIYINPDLTKEEAKLAYERRHDRRQRREGESVAVGPDNVGSDGRAMTFHNRSFQARMRNDTQHRVNPTNLISCTTSLSDRPVPASSNKSAPGSTPSTENIAAPSCVTNVLSAKATEYYPVANAQQIPVINSAGNDPMESFNN